MSRLRLIRNGKSQCLYERYTELSDAVHARNKHEDYVLNIRLKSYERDKDIRLNLLRKDQRQIERVRFSLSEQRAKMHYFQQYYLPLPNWLSKRACLQDQFVEISKPKLDIDDSQLNTPNPIPSSETNLHRRHTLN